MLGLSPKEKITKLICTVSQELIGVYKSAYLNYKSNNISESELQSAVSIAKKEYEDAVAEECLKRIIEKDSNSGRIMKEVLDKPSIVGFDDHDFDHGKGAGFVYCAAYFALTGKINKDFAYCVSLNHTQGKYLIDSMRELDYIMQVNSGDPYNGLKKSRNNNADTLFDGVKNVGKMLFSNKTMFPRGENCEAMSRIVGLCAYLIAGWFTSSDPEKARKVCQLYGDSIRVQGKSTRYVDDMLNIVNESYKEIRDITDKTVKSTVDVSVIVNEQAKRFASISSITENENNIYCIEEGIFFFINQYLVSNAEKTVEKSSEIVAFGVYSKEEASDIKKESQISVNESQLLCPKCKIPIPEGGKFCPKCGIIVRRDEKSQSIKSYAEPNNIDAHNTNEIVTDESMEQLRKIKQLFDEGILTEDEFLEMKRAILNIDNNYL